MTAFAHWRSLGLELAFDPALPVGRSPNGQSQLADALANLDAERLLRFYPRDPSGRYGLSERVLLAPIDLATGAREPKRGYLFACSPTKRSSPQVITLALLSEDDRNFRHRWSDARWLWDRRHAGASEEVRWGVGGLPVELLVPGRANAALVELSRVDNPTPGQRAAHAIILVRAGDWREALALYGLGHALDELPYQHANHAAGVEPARWDAGLAAELADLAPWRLSQLAVQIDPRARMFLLPGQTTTRKFAVTVRTVAGKPQLAVMISGSNARVPDLWWRWPPDLAMIVRGEMPPPAPVRQPRASRELDLKAQLAANPTDLDIRRVYADVLTERELPRGEFITLQLLSAEGQLDKPRLYRMAALEREHGTAWLGPLGPLVDVAEYENGFLSRVVLGGAKTPFDAYRAVLLPEVAHELAPIRTVTIGYSFVPALVRALLARERLPLLERLSMPSFLVGAVVRAVAHLELTIPYTTEPSSLTTLPLALEAPPTELSLVLARPEHVGPIAAQIFGRALREVIPAATHRIGVRSTLDLTLSRDDQGRLSRLDVQWGGKARKTLVSTIELVLAACPDGALTQLSIGAKLTKPEAARLRRALTRCAPGADLISDPD